MARQTSGLSAFYERTGWPHGEFKDTGPVFDLEKQLADTFPVRKVLPMYYQDLHFENMPLTPAD